MDGPVFVLGEHYTENHPRDSRLTLPQYLQHFDLPGMLATTDFVNIMSYDLHGTWDGTDPWIGKVVGAHTNLTEIKNTLQLFQNVFTTAAQWKQVRAHSK
jgi:GH18 family chitinase